MVIMTKSWSLIFLKSKQFTRFYQSLGMFQVQSYSTTPSVFIKQTPSILNMLGLNLFNCSRKILNYTTYNTKPVYITPFSNTPLTGLLTRDKDQHPTILNLNPGLTFYDNELFIFDVNSRTLEYLNQFPNLYKNLLNLIFKTTLIYIKVLYFLKIKLTQNLLLIHDKHF